MVLLESKLTTITFEDVFLVSPNAIKESSVAPTRCTNEEKTIK